MIQSLKDNEVILVGTNTEGRHGKGLARQALLMFGLKYGHSKGMCGKCYCIVTKDLRKGKRSISLEEIEEQLEKFYLFVKDNPQLIFYLTPIGSGLGGYSIEEIELIFDKFKWPSNCVHWRNE